jgi:hypothetical protein
VHQIQWIHLAFGLYRGDSILFGVLRKMEMYLIHRSTPLSAISDKQPGRCQHLAQSGRKLSTFVKRHVRELDNNFDGAKNIS